MSDTLQFVVCFGLFNGFQEIVSFFLTAVEARVQHDKLKCIGHSLPRGVTDLISTQRWLHGMFELSFRQGIQHFTFSHPTSPRHCHSILHVVQCACRMRVD